MGSRIYAEWHDAANGFLRSGNWADTGASDTAFETALINISNAQLTVLTFGLAAVSTTTPSTSSYPLVNTTAVLNFVTGIGSGIQLTVPAPIASIFGPDNITVDPSNTLVAALITSVLGFLTDAAGNVATAYTTGIRSSRKVEQSG